MSEEQSEKVIEEFHDYTNESKIMLLKLRKRTIITLISFIVIIVVSFWRKYQDFDIALNSVLFQILLIISGIATVINLSFFFLKNEKQRSKKFYYLLKQQNDIFEILMVIPLFIGIITLSNAFLISPASVTKKSMEPNYYEGDNILVYHFFEEYNRFDVIVAKMSEDDYYIKRIIGLPGEEVKIVNNEIYIDGELLDDPTILKDGSVTTCNIGINPDTSLECTFEVPQDSYFVMGDNREASLDSRTVEVGYISEEQLYGRVILRFQLFK